MAWTIEYAPRVVKAFKKDLDREIVRRLISKLEEAAGLDDPTATAKPMRGTLRGLWSYRIVGGYRVIADVQADRLVIFAVEAGARRDVYED
ncbi:type II toxin-antitoxin system RelE family toxin [Paramicrobacterium fandaimingii]|uniref:type II toxin-antitoxin system RelE family toxin n=1 Tax=Paramicrobacterium fandaimingii TaxID=2708079 RepID=UPI00141EC711|nr:type II toxin-antitoxin system RelE/ParE family toxin [Microbacterium fandaimingii]